MRAMRQTGRGHHMISHGIGWLVAETLIMATIRFFTGQIVTRRPGRYDSRWSTWAVPVSRDIELSRMEGVPRTTWARRPGWHRFSVRLGVIVGLFALLTWPTLTVVAFGVGLAVVATRRVLAVQTERHYRDSVASWAEFVAGKLDHPLTTSPMRWVSFGSGVRWEEWAPMAGLAHEDGPLARWPRMRAWAQWLATPIGERDFATRALATATAGTGGDDAPSRVARTGASTVTALVRLAERARTLRRRPRIHRPDLADDEAEFSVHYPATYPAHREDVGVWANVIAERTPGDWTHENHHRELRVRFTHPARLASDCPMGPEVFGQYPPTVVPIGTSKNGLVTIPVKDKTPHVSVAASTGWGKTTTANVLAAHCLYHGWHGLISDPKRVGFVGAFRGASDKVELRTTLTGMIHAIMQVRDEMNRRYELIENHLDTVPELGLPSMKDNPEMYFQQLFMLEDEKGSLTVAIKAWWKREGGGRKLPDGTVIPWYDALFSDEGTPVPGKGDPEPIIMLQEILWRGRAAAVHVFTLAQQNNLNVFANSDMRDQYMFRVLSGPQTQSSWIMTFPGTRKRAIAAKKGRAVFGIGPEDLQEIHLGRISDADARRCAEIGTVTAREENERRADRLALVTGRPRWEVSPCPWWVPRPAETGVNVPGHGTDTDTEQDTPALPSGAGDQAILVDDEEVQDAVSSNVVELPPESDGIHFGDEEDTPEDARAGARAGNGLVTGVQNAADFLDISKAAMDKRLQRMRRGEVPEIPGMTHVGRSLAFPKPALIEWASQFRTGGQDDDEGEEKVA